MYIKYIRMCLRLETTYTFSLTYYIIYACEMAAYILREMYVRTQAHEERR